MTNDEMKKILDRATSDDDYLGRLLSKPAEACGELGIALTDEEATTIGSMSADEMRAFAAEMDGAGDPDKRRAAC